MGNSRKLHKEENHNMCVVRLLGFRTKEAEIVGICDICQI